MTADRKAPAVTDPIPSVARPSEPLAALLACGKPTKHGPHDDCVGIPLPVLHPLPEESLMTDTAIAMRYRKRPVEISAAQWNGSVGWATPIIDWILQSGGTARFHDAPEAGGADFIAIDTLEGTMQALAGDFIIQGVQGEFYPCKPDIFAATYDRVTDGSAT